jgi:hypothetical protein
VPLGLDVEIAAIDNLRQPLRHFASREFDLFIKHIPNQQVRTDRNGKRLTNRRFFGTCAEPYLPGVSGLWLHILSAGFVFRCIGSLVSFKFSNRFPL